MAKKKNESAFVPVYAEPIPYGLEDAIINQGDVYLVDFEPIAGSEIGKIRPAIVVSTNAINRGNTVIVVPISSSPGKTAFPTRIPFDTKDIKGLDTRKAEIRTEHIRAVDKCRLVSYAGKVPSDILRAIRRSFAFSFGNIQWDITKEGEVLIPSTRRTYKGGSSSKPRTTQPIKKTTTHNRGKKASVSHGSTTTPFTMTPADTAKLLRKLSQRKTRP